MPQLVTIGPLAFPLERLLAVALLWGFLAFTLWLVRRDEKRSTSKLPWVALATGIAVARLSFVIANWQTYRSDPATIFYLWQGGFDALPGIVAAAVILAFGLRDLRRAGGALLALTAASAIWFGYVQLEAAQPRPQFPQGIRITNLDGREIPLDALRGRPFVVNLWASWCGPCRREMPMLVETAAEMQDLTILLVNQGEDPQLVRRFLRDEKLPGERIALDRGAVLMRRTDGGGLPATLFVRADGRIEKAHMGELSKAALLSEIRHLKQVSQP